MKDLCVDADKITNFLDCDRMTGAVLDKFLLLQVEGEAIISQRRKIEWAIDIGIKSDTVSRKIRHLVRIGILQQKDKKTFVMSGIYYCEKPNKKIGFFKRFKINHFRKKQNKLFFEN